jgi:hypothetical protein
VVADKARDSRWAFASPPAAREHQAETELFEAVDAQRVSFAEHRYNPPTRTVRANLASLIAGAGTTPVQKLFSNLRLRIQNDRDITINADLTVLAAV